MKRPPDCLSVVNQLRKSVCWNRRVDCNNLGASPIRTGGVRSWRIIFDFRHKRDNPLQFNQQRECSRCLIPDFDGAIFSHAWRELEIAVEAQWHESEDGGEVAERTSVADLPTGPKEPRSTVLSVEEEAVIVAFRRHMLLPLDAKARQQIHRLIDRLKSPSLPAVCCNLRERITHAALRAPEFCFSSTPECGASH